MANLAKLRVEARKHEEREQWRDAILAYRQIIDNPEGEDVDIGLYNRIGDLHLRLNETELAVQAYESAVKAYVDVGLYNNAIALCRKILRLVPGRAVTYRTLGQISAAKGFLADARQNFLEYAERMRRAGKVDESFEALKEFADLSPGDTDVRRLLADQLLHHGRGNEAVEQLRILLGALLSAGDEAGAEQVRGQILGIDANASTEPLLREARPARKRDDLTDAFDTGVLGPPRGGAPPAPADAEPPAPGARPEGFDTGAGIEPTAAGPGFAASPGVSPIEGFEPTIDAESPFAARAPEEEETPEGGDLPLLDLDADEDAGADDALRGGGYARLDVEDASGFDLADGDEDDEGGDDDAEPLPLLDVEDYRPRPSVAELRERVAAAPDDAGARTGLIARLHEEGQGHEVPAVLEQAHRALAARGAFREAIGPISELIALRPDDPALLQKRVEYAFRSGDRDALVAAYLALGRSLAERGDEAKARAVFQRVLEQDPHNEEARRAVAPPQPASAPPPPSAAAPAPAAAAADYIDLGTLILGDEQPQPTTRFVVEEKEPSGDEDKDFAEMLAHFRQKVAENIQVEDSSSHYDLGLAFKEMGLLDEAIAEFQVALRGGASPLATLELLGQCFVEKGQYAVAARVLDRALRLPDTSDAELVGVLYQLGRSEEALGRAASAIEYYERVLSVDIRFRDAGRRADALRAAAGAPRL